VNRIIPEASPAPTLCVSIVVYESDLLRLAATLDSLCRGIAAAAQAGALGAVRIVLHDNASSPSYGLRLRRLYRVYARRLSDIAELSLSQALRNEGYGRGHNRALAGAAEDLLLVLNPDVEVAPSALIAGLTALRDFTEAVAVGPRCERDDGRREYLCKRYPAVLDLLLRGFAPALIRRPFRRRLDHYEYRDLDATGTVTLLSGACLLLRREVFERVGGFDPGFFMYFEDFDLSLRAGRHGSLLYLPAMRVVHHGGGAARKGWRHLRWFALSARRFYSRHGWRWA
jgi:GT2 family glycosyltransferase